MAMRSADVTGEAKPFERRSLFIRAIAVPQTPTISRNRLNTLIYEEIRGVIMLIRETGNFLLCP